jgi:hypothetical protein
MKIENRHWENFKRKIGEIVVISLVVFGIETVLYYSLGKLFFGETPSLLEAFLGVNAKAFGLAFIVYYLPSLAILFYTYLDIKGKKSFFFRIGEWENPLQLGKPKRLWYFKDTHGILSLTEKEFVDIVFGGSKKRYALTLAFFNGEIIETKKIKFKKEEINKAIEYYTNSLVEWGYAIFKLKPEDEKLFRATIYFSLMHYVASLYGNIPASFLSPIVYNDIINDFKSWYYYRKLNVVPENVSKGLKNRWQKVRDFLTILHSYPEDIFESLRRMFSPLSFEKDMEFEEEKWQNKLSDSIPKEELVSEERKKVA